MFPITKAMFPTKDIYQTKDIYPTRDIFQTKELFPTQESFPTKDMRLTTKEMLLIKGMFLVTFDALFADGKQGPAQEVPLDVWLFSGVAVSSFLQDSFAAGYHSVWKIARTTK